MNRLLELLTDKEHTRQNWLEGWPVVRAHTALEPHEVDLVDVDEAGITLRMPIGDHARQPMGLLHGGVSMLLAESAASMHACWGVDLRRRAPVGIEISGSHLRSASQGAVLCKARVLRRSATLIHHEVEILEEDSGRQLSVIRVTNLYKSFGE